MAKQKKNKFDNRNVIVNDEPLSITKIGEIENQNQGALMVLVIFVILIGFIVGLPYFINSRKDNKIENNTVNPSNGNKEKEENEPKKEIIYHDLKENLSITFDNLQLTDFKIENNTLSFRIMNNGNSRYQFDKHNYYIELYTENKTLLERIKMKSDSLSKGESLNYSYVINAEAVVNSKSIVFVEKTEGDYPNISLIQDEKKEGSLVCVNGTHTITYKFKDEKLSAITDKFTYDMNQENYENLKLKYQNDEKSYNSSTGVMANFVDIGTGFVFNANIDLNQNKNSSKLSSYYYKEGTLAKVVDFEMKAQGFDCK